MPDVAVIGAGVVGLSTALNIQKKIPNARVRIIADKYTKTTTSHGAGGIFLPTTEEIQGVPEETLKKWCKASWEFYSDLAQSSKAVDTGHEVVSGYVPCMNRKNEDPVYKDIVFSYKELSEEEIKKLNFSEKYKYCYEVTTIITTVSIYLPWLMSRFRENGGEIENRKITDIREFVDKYDVVVNCTGFGSKKLFGDKDVYVIRGQVLRVKAPWIKTWRYSEDGTYILPNRNLVVLGGIRQTENENLEVDPNDSKIIQQICSQLNPAIEGYKLDHEWVGLRPFRSPIRLEKEVLQFDNGKQLKVVHNYGHGANGIALSWGTSVEAAEIVKEVLSETTRSKL